MPGNRVSHPRGVMIQTLFASLLAAGDRFVGRADALAEELWGGTRPPGPTMRCRPRSAGCRRLLARAEPDNGAQRLTANFSGYRLSVHWTELDAAVFQHNVDVVRDRPAADLRRDVADLRNALTLWRGPVFGGLLGVTICQTAAAKYEESKMAALGLLYDLELKIGGHARIIPELTELTHHHPLCEQFCSLLMVALYRSGRQIDALDVYRRLKRRLDEDLGIEPSPVLRRYEQAILNHDPRLIASQQRLAPELAGTATPGPQPAERLAG